LPVAVKGQNLRRTAPPASTEAGVCESLSCCISHHSMEHAVSAYFPNVPHGAGLTMLSVAYFSYLAERNPARFPDLARAMGEKIDGLPKKEQAMAFIKGLKKLIKKIGLHQQKLSDFGIQREDLRKLAENSSTWASCSTAP
jgi:alcohol dehydrogenase